MKDFAVVATAVLQVQPTAARPNALVSWVDYELDADGLLVDRGAPEDTAQVSHHCVAVRFFPQAVVDHAAGVHTVTLL